MKYLIPMIFLFSSCNVLKNVIGDGESPDQNFFGKHCDVDGPDVDGNGTADNCEFQNDNTTIDETVYSLNDNLLVFWRMEETSGTRFDLNNNYNLSEDYSVPGSAGQIGSCVDCFSGSGSGHFLSSSLALSFNTSDSWSIAFWADKNENSFGGCSDEEYVIEFGAGTSYIQFDNIDCENDFSDIRMRLNGMDYNFEDVANFPNFHHFTFVVHSGGATVDLYVNGAFIDSVSLSASGLSTSTIGLCTDGGGAIQLAGVLDSVGIWDRALNSDEIAALFNGNNDLD